MDHKEPGLTAASLLHGFKPAQPFETTRSRSALTYLREAFTSGRSLAVLNSGWTYGSNSLIQSFVREVGPSASLIRVPGSCASELEGMRELITAIGFDSKNLSIEELQQILVKFLGFERKRKRRTILILEDSCSETEWVRNYVSQLVKIESASRFGLLVILARQTKFDQLADEKPLDALSHRAAKHIALTPFTVAETRKFVRWRIDVTESADIGRIFDLQAVTLIHELCEGIPDAIEHICCESLELADSEDVAPVTTDIVIRASKDLPSPSLTRRPGAQSRLSAEESARIPTLELPDGPTIILDYKGKTIRRVPLNQQRISIGRADDCDLCITSPFVSRKHATIFRNGAETAVVDLDSKNGTYVNERKIKVQTIADQDEITIGYHTIRFSDPNAPRIRPLNHISTRLRREPPADTAEKVVRVRR